MKSSIILLVALTISITAHGQTLDQIKQLSPDAVPVVLDKNLLVYPAVDNDVASARVIAGDTIWVVIVATRHHYGVATQDRGFLGYANKNDLDIDIPESANIMRTSRPFPRIDTSTVEGYYDFLSFKPPHTLTDAEMQFIHMVDHQQKSKDVKTIRHVMVYFAAIVTVSIIGAIIAAASAS